VAGGLAARGDDLRPVDDLRSAQRGGVQIPPPHLRGAAVGLFALLRNEGGSVCARAAFYQQTGDPAGSVQKAWQAVANLIQQQASSLAYFDVFWLFSMLALVLVPLVLVMRRSVAEKGAHLMAE
jgi:DHA2 family multidrug resistance protein